MWQKGNPNALLVGKQTSEATVEDSMEFPQKIKNKLPFDPEIPLLEIRIPEHRFKRTFAPICSKQHYLQSPSTGNSLGVHQ